MKLFIENSNNFIKNTAAKEKRKTAKIFCDKLHYRNHIDPWCRRNTNPYKDSIVNSTNTEICEQIQFFPSHKQHYLNDHISPLPLSNERVFMLNNFLFIIQLIPFRQYSSSFDSDKIHRTILFHYATTQALIFTATMTLHSILKFTSSPQVNISMIQTTQ